MGLPVTDKKGLNEKEPSNHPTGLLTVLFVWIMCGSEIQDDDFIAEHGVDASTNALNALA